ncbi:MAG: MBL fold metallo-hydrolase [Chloroflexi bacterium]|nr:MAG: MBL fold metallo-hydrolase [Chloroflexota bacterium]
MAIQIFKFTLGLLQTNCFIIGDTDTKDAIVIDPSDRAPVLHQTALNEGWTIREILATHGHFDHIMASAPLKALSGATFRVHQRDMTMVRTMSQQVRRWFDIDVPPAANPDRFVKEGDVITAGGIMLDVLHTPGHSPGHVSYVLRSENVVFSGDCLFFSGIGRTDQPNSDYDTLMHSITEKLLPLGDGFAVAPGHMRNTTIGYERQNNPYLLEYLNAEGE